MKKRARQVAWSVFAGFTLMAFARALSADMDAPERVLSAAERTAVGAAAAAEETAWRLESRRRFPGDAWSQDDDFHGMERSWVNGQAASRDVSPAEIFRAIDEDLHAHPPSPPRKANASPCKPRAFYD